MIVKIMQESTGRYRLFEGDDIMVNPSVEFLRDGNYEEAEDDLGIIQVHHSFPENFVLALGEKKIEEFSFSLIQIIKNKVYENIVVDRTQYDVYILENGKTIEHF